MNEYLIKKYNEKVRRGPECWGWEGSTRMGYGMLSYPVAPGKRSTVGAHRVSYYLHYGVDPGKLFVCHKCDNPICTRPDHLFLGTAADNNADMWAKGRGQWSDDLIVQARRMAHEGKTFEEIYRQLGKERHGLHNAITGKTYGWVTEPPCDIELKVPRKKVKLSAKDIEEIRKAFENDYWGLSKKLATKYGVDHSTISHIKTGRYYGGESQVGEF
jgi:hypothetical protein